MLSLQLMKEVIFSTGNATKFVTASQACAKCGVRLVQQNLEIDEIQGEDAEKIAIDKATKAYALIKKPVVVSDNSWAFLGLKGFPGPYMSSINHWFTPEDFLHLTLPLTDRAVTLTQYIIYQNKDVRKVFTAQCKGKLLKEIRGISVHPNHTIITMSGDDGLSIAEVYNSSGDNSSRSIAELWKEFARWYIKNTPN